VTFTLNLCPHHFEKCSERFDVSDGIEDLLRIGDDDLVICIKHSKPKFLTVIPNLGGATQWRECCLDGGYDLLVRHHRCDLTSAISGGAQSARRLLIEPLDSR
jgi:hypothetical protein